MGPPGRERFLAVTPFIKGQVLMACSAENKWFFQEQNPGRTLTLTGLLDHWCLKPDPAHSAAARYRNHDLNPVAEAC